MHHEEPQQEAPVEGVVLIGKRWEFGTLGDHVADNVFQVRYRKSNGNIGVVKRDVKDDSVWREGVTVLPDADAEKPAKAKAAAAPKKPSPKPKAKSSSEIMDYKTGPAKKGHNTFPASDAKHTCTGMCGKQKPSKSFPTIHGTDRRASECRACRDTRRPPKSKTEAAA